MQGFADIENALVVEDDFLLALDVVEALNRIGVDNTEVRPTCVSGAEAARGDIQFATVDIKLADGMCYDVVAELEGRGIPFVYVSGYDPSHHPRLPKRPGSSNPC